MQALVKFRKGKKNVELREVAEPRVEPDQVKIRIKAAGICATDIHIYYDEYPNNPPVIMGHELSGIVAEVGKKVKNIAPGDRVTSQTAQIICGECMFCKTGYTNLCIGRRSIGSGVDGAFAKYCVVRKDLIHTIPDNVDFDSAALTEPLACCVNGVIENTGINAGEVVLVSGPGTIGLLVLQLAKANGAKVIVSGTSADREKLSLARKLGADITVNCEKEDVIMITKELTDGYGADVVIECAGAGLSVQQCLKLARKKGRYLQMGLLGKPAMIEVDQLVYKELSVFGSFSHKWSSFHKALLLLKEGKVKTGPLVSDRRPLSEWKSGFEKLEKKLGLKVLLYPEE